MLQSRAKPELTGLGEGFSGRLNHGSSCWPGGRPAWIVQPYSEDLRGRVVAAVEGGMSRSRVASLFGLGISTVVNWVRRWHDTGSIGARAMGGDHRSRLGSEREWILRRTEAKPDLTLEEIRAELKQLGVSVGYKNFFKIRTAIRADWPLPANRSRNSRVRATPILAIESNVYMRRTTGPA